MCKDDQVSTVDILEASKYHCSCPDMNQASKQGGCVEST